MVNIDRTDRKAKSQRDIKNDLEWRKNINSKGNEDIDDGGQGIRRACEILQEKKHNHKRQPAKHETIEYSDLACFPKRDHGQDRYKRENATICHHQHEQNR